MIQYLSQEWVDAVKTESCQDESYLEKAKGFTARQKAVFTDCPGDIDILVEWQWEDGKLISASREEAPAPSSWRNPQEEEGYLASIVGGYDAMSRIAKKELTAQSAMGKGLYAVHGDQLKLFSKMGKLNAFSVMCASIPTEF